MRRSKTAAQLLPVRVASCGIPAPAPPPPDRFAFALSGSGKANGVVTALHGDLYFESEPDERSGYAALSSRLRERTLGFNVTGRILDFEPRLMPRWRLW